MKANDKSKYQVGDLLCFHKDDPTFDDWDAALRKAIGDSEDVPIGIWTSQDDGSALLAIVYCQEVFKK